MFIVEKAASRLELFNSFVDKAFLYISILKEKIHEGNVSDSLLIMVDDNTRNNIQENQNICEVISSSIVKIIRDIESQIGSNYTKHQCEEFILILCALFDEMAINSLKGKNWNNYLVEKSIFMTAIAGEKVILNLCNHNNTHLAKDNEMSIVYYYALCLGFRGMYHAEPRKFSIIKNKTFYSLKEDYNVSEMDKITYLSSNMYAFISRNEKISNPVNYDTLYLYALSSFLVLVLLVFLYMLFVHIKFKLSKIIE